MAADSKTEKPTAKKRRDERKEGNVFLSNDVNNIISIFASFYALKVFFPSIHKTVREFMMRYISSTGTLTDTSMGTLQAIGNDFMITVVKVILPFLLICVALAILSTGIQTKFLFSSKSCKPKFSRLSPLQGIKKLISLKSLVELFKNILKIIVLIWILYGILKADMAGVIRTMDMSIAGSVVYTFDLIMKMILKVTMVFIVVAAFDYVYQWWEYERKIKMSKQEVKEEFKQTEGNPEIKSKIRDIQRQRARARMMQAVPTADVIIRNPTHFAVALKYDMEHSNAPIVVAKGQDELALRIIRVGEENKVIIIENRPLARALYAQTKLDQEIPLEYYGAVAEILVYVYKMNKKME